jgi:hypothetical protein
MRSQPWVAPALLQAEVAAAAAALPALPRAAL